MSGIITMMIYGCLFAIAAIGIFFFIRKRTSGKLLVFLLEKDKSIKHYLFKPRGALFKFAKTDEQGYVIDPECVMLTSYPLGSMLPEFVKQIVPALIYAAGNPQPLDPVEVSKPPKGISSSMVASVMSDNVMKGIIQGVEAEGMKSRIPAWFFPVIMTLLMMVVMFYIYTMNTKIDALIGE